MGQKKLGFGPLVSGLAFGAVACGGGGSPAAGFTSASDLKAALQSPTGTVSPETAAGVAAAFEESSTSGIGASARQKAQAQSGSESCSEGGSISYNASQTMVQASYNNCVESGCTINGKLNILLESASETEVSGCMSIEASTRCEGDLVASNLAYSGCFGIGGDSFTFAYLIEYEGDTYTVSGNYSSGSGSLTITGVNGSFTCSYTEDAGTCTSTTGDSFEFTASSGSDLESGTLDG